ncbi:antibiotic biosynthesis monooxygenase [Nonomuraea sp. NPDC050404]|uniref:antibiotic biosynthesis monooxygenase family protein n=1 Tax=Nonomuraea sp. NPDC050404 TaxID=3155783 RepID=UPI0033D8E22A
MIARVWKATATPDGARRYAEHFDGAVLPELRDLPGCRAAHLLTRESGDQVAIEVITYWESLETIRAFAGDDLGHAVVEPAARAALTDFERTVTHFTVARTWPAPDEAVTA